MAQSAARRSGSAVRMPPERRKQQLLDSAQALVIRSGYANATMQAVAREAGVTRPVVYEFYSDRAELLRDLLERETQKAFALVLGMAPDPDRDEDLGAILRSTLARFLSLVVSEPQTSRLLLLSPSGAPAEVRAGVEATRAVVFAAVQSYLEPLTTLPGSAESDTELLALTFLAGSESAARLVLKDPEQFPPERISAVVSWFISQFDLGRRQ
ncbi:TetR/AcrR family transcriptional regulator [Nocardia sp. NBC_01388]|uniref:TetR/AcrR family transcriptional regulator n=1 Tax=Nocardia sp. NBC_01388 TaxID=2903596 RepID=UPI00324B958A